MKITENAANEVKKIISEQDMSDDTVIRVAVAGGGCSGFEYKLGFDTEVNETDTIIDMHDVRIVVDKKSLLYLEGTEIDFYTGLDKRGFVFNNPNATKSCGCGSSFQV